jgi:hypothetical protein
MEEMPRDEVRGLLSASSGQRGKRHMSWIRGMGQAVGGKHVDALFARFPFLVSPFRPFSPSIDGTPKGWNGRSEGNDGPTTAIDKRRPVRPACVAEWSLCFSLHFLDMSLLHLLRGQVLGFRNAYGRWLFHEEPTLSFPMFFPTKGREMNGWSGQQVPSCVRGQGEPRGVFDLEGFAGEYCHGLFPSFHTSLSDFFNFFFNPLSFISCTHKAR